MKAGGWARAIAALAAGLLALLLAAGAARATSVVEAIARADSADALRWTFDLDAAPETRLVALSNPDRIVLDLIDTVPAVALPEAGEGPVASVRHGFAGTDRYRLIFTLRRPVDAEIRRTEGAKGPGFELVLTASRERVSRVLDEGGEAAPAAGLATGAPGGKGGERHVIVVDAGHGGEDTGAKGASGTQEKDVNLAFALALAEELGRHADIEVVLTRKDDGFIGLTERAEIARQAGADLFLSVHADSIRYPELRGATVYTLSARASDDLSRQIADSENASDRFAAPGTAPPPEIVDILADLIRRETVGFSEHFATDLVRRLGEAGVRLIKNPKRSAGFRVLTAPDVPSVLVELGYLSNKEDEKLLSSAEWRHETARIMAGAVADYIRSRAPQAGRG